MAANSGMVAPVSVKTSMSYDDSKADDFERKSMGSDEGSDDYKVCFCAGSQTRASGKHTSVHAHLALACFHHSICCYAMPGVHTSCCACLCRILRCRCA
jgi:hypothetical protein